MGGFSFPDLDAGTWRVVIRHVSFHPYARELRLATGEQGDLGAIALFDASQEAPARIVGRALLAGQGEDDNGGTRVEVIGTPYVGLTASDGSYQIPVAPGRFRVRFVHAGYGSGEAEAPEAVEGQDAPMPDVTLVGTPGRLRGSVSLEAGLAPPDAVQGADVRLERDGESHAQTRPDARGVFIFDGIPPGSYDLVASLDGFVDRRVPVEVEFGRTTDMGQVQLAAVTLRVRIAGRGLLSGRAAHEGIQVALVGSDLRANTDVTGAFELEAPLRQAPYSLRFTRPGYNAEEAIAEAPTAEQVGAHLADHVGEDQPPPIAIAPDPVDVTLAARPGSIRGRVTLAAGFDDPQLLASIAVRLIDLDAPAPAPGEPEVAPVAEVAPDARGDFRFDDVQPGTYGIEFGLPDFFAQPLQATLEPGESIVVAGRVLSPTAEGDRAFIQGVARRACEGDCDHGGIRVEALNFPFVAFTGRNGNYRLEVIALDDYTLVFSAPGYASEEVLGVDAVADDTTPVDDVTLAARPGAVRALVALRSYGTEARLGRVDAALWTDPPGQDPVRSGRPDSRGEVLFDGVLPGAYAVRVDGPGYQPQAHRVLVGPGEQVSAGAFDLAHDAGAPEAPRLRGVVRLDDVADAAGTDVRVRIAEDDLAFGDPLRTDADGRFELPASADERYLVTVTRAGYDAVDRLGPLAWDAADARFEDEVGAPVDLTLRRTPLPGTMRGLVSLRSYATPTRLQAVDVALWADPPGGAALRTVQPGANGEFIFANAPPGAYEVRIGAVGYEPQARRVTLQPAGDVVAGIFELVHQSEGPSAVILSGRITLAAAQEHAGTTVRVRLVGPDLPFGASLITDADGHFELPASPAERYTVQVSRPGYAAPAPPIGPLSWSVARGRFEDDGGGPAERTLARTPIRGRVQVAVDVLPAWLPAAEKYARVRLTGPVSVTEEPVFPGGGGVTFDDLPEGTYQVSVERLGFAGTTRQVALTSVAPTADLGVLALNLENLAAARLDLRGHALDACDLRLGSLSLRNADFSGVVLSGDLGQASACPNGRAGPLDLTGADFSGADLRGARFARAAGQDAVKLVDARLANARLEAVDLTGVSAVGADFFGAQLIDATLAQADLTHANFTGADLTRARFVRPQLTNGAPVSDPRGPWPSLWASLEPMPDLPCDNVARPTVNLDGAVMARANLTGAFLPGAMLRGVDMAGARIVDADLRHTCLDRAQLTLLDLSGTVLDGADARDAEFTSSLLRGTSLRGTTLSRASMVSTVIDRADVRPSPRAACGQLRSWEEYEAGGACTRDLSAACRCRTLLDGAALDGANLVGTSFEGVDLAGASLLGVTLGQVAGVAFAQPQSCQPGAYFDCLRVVDILGTCGIALPPESESRARCEDDPGNFDELADGLNSVEQARCILDVYATDNGCARVGDCFLGGLPPVVAPRWQHGCDWSSIRADGDADRPLGSQCVWDQEVRVHPPCGFAPTVLNDVRLDGAQMTAVVLNGITLDRVSLRGARVRAAVFLDNTFGEVDLTDADLGSATLAGAVLEGVELSGANLGGADLSGASLDGSTLAGTDFTDANLSGVSMQFDPEEPALPASFRRVDLRGAVIGGARWNAPQGEDGLSFAEADLSSVSFNDVQADGADFGRAFFHNTSVSPGSRMQGASFSGATFDGGALLGDMTGAIFYQARFDGTSMYSFLGVSMQGASFDRAIFTRVEATAVQFQNARLADTTILDSFLNRADLRGVQGDGMLLLDSSARGADFTGARIRDARMVDTTFARFTSGGVRTTTFASACLRRTDFRGSNLEYAIFTNADLQATQFDGAWMRYADLTNTCNLTFYTGAFDGADMQGATICTRDQVLFNARNSYVGTPSFVVCRTNPVCPAGCN